MQSQKYLIAALNKLQLKDSKAAKYFLVTKGSMSRYRSGERVMSPEMAVKVAEVLNIEPLQIIMICEKERSKENKRTFWEKQIEMRYTIIFALFISSISEMTPSPSYAGQWLSSSVNTVYYVK